MTTTAAIHLVAGASLLGCLFAFVVLQRSARRPASGWAVLSVFVAAFVLRMVLAGSQVGFNNDVTSFAAWADRMYDVGPRGFYSTEVFTDYPPLYMYVLYVVGWLREVFQPAPLGSAHLVLIKLPAILLDLVLGYVLYRQARPRFGGRGALVLAAAYLFLPAILLNSAVWGQVDAAHTLLVVLMCLFLTRGQTLPAYAAFGIGVLLKPQTVIFTPVLLVGILDHVFRTDFRKEKILANLAGGLSVILGMALAILPFGVGNVVSQYIETLTSYPYASANAYNLWTLFGLNWSSQDAIVGFFSAQTWGTVVIASIVVLTFLGGWRLREEPAKYVLLSAFVAITMFVFSVRMHERYVYPALALLLFTFVYTRDRRIQGLYAALAVLHFYNTAHVLYFYDPAHFDPTDMFTLSISASMVIFYGVFATVFTRLIEGRARREMPAAGDTEKLEDTEELSC